MENQPTAFEYGLIPMGDKTLAFKKKSFNDLIVAKRENTFWQRTGNAFQYVYINEDNEFVVNSISGSPMVLQAGASGCSTKPTKGLSFGSDSLSGNKAHAAISFCEDELLDTCFKGDYKWASDGKLELDPKVITKLTKIILQSISQGLFLALISGGTYDATDLSSKENVPLEEAQLYIQTVGAHVGLVPMLKNESANYPHWNVPSLYKASEQDGMKFTGSAVKVFEGLTSYAEDGGLSVGYGVSETPEDYVCVVDTHTYSRIGKEFRAQCENVGTVLQKCKDAIEKRTIDGKKVYFIHDVQIVPLKEIVFYDKYVGQTSRFMAIEKKKNFVLGGSITKRGTNLTGLRLRKVPTEGGMNKYVLAANFLLLTHIADSNEVVATQAHFKKK